MLGADSWDSWLDPDRELDLGLLRVPDSVAGIETRRVSSLVNSVANNGPELLVPDDGAAAVGSRSPCCDGRRHRAGEPDQIVRGQRHL